MCGTIARNGLRLAALSIFFFFAGALVTTGLFITLWWGPPSSWPRLEGLPDRPQTLAAIQPSEERFLVRTTDGTSYACQEGSCAPSEDWSTEPYPCEETNRPFLTSIFRMMPPWNIELSLGCEISYQSTGRNIFLVQDRQGSVYSTGGPTMIPADAAAAGMGLMGGLFWGLLALFAGAVSLLIRSRRPPELGADSGSTAPSAAENRPGR